MPIVDPMLAAHLSKEKTDALFNNDEWVAEEKLDGSRYTIHLSATINRVFSKNISKKNGLPVEKTENIPHISHTILEGYDGTIIDGEVTAPGKDFRNALRIMGSSPEKALKVQIELGKAEFHSFDCLFYKGKDVRMETYTKRRALTEDVMKAFNSAGILQVKLTDQFVGPQKKIACEAIWARGGEGIILKYIHGTYIEGEPGRSSRQWVKVKGEITDDVVIMGFAPPTEWYAKPGEAGADGVVHPTGKHTKFHERGWIGAIEFGKYKNGTLTYIGQCSGMDEETRKEFSVHKQKYIGQVIEIKAQFRFNGGAYRHGNFVRLRPDKSPIQCVEI